MSRGWALAGLLTVTGCGGYLSADNAGQLAPYPSAERDPVNEPPAQSFNPYVEAAHDPFSTFAADVDTASYDIFFKSMTEGAGPPAPETVRSEEFVNFFRYDYPAPAPQSPHPFEIDLDFGPAPYGETMLLRVGVQGRDMLEDRAPANLVFLVDVSGSMGAPDKLPVAQDMLRSALGVLRPNDKISLVTYAGSVRVVLPPTPVSQRSRIDAAISDLSSGGSTAGADGLQLAYDQAQAGFIRGGINHIIMCTDGDFNVGPYSTEEIVDLVETRRSSGVTFTALGFGLGNLNDSMMEAVSNAGNGIYRVIGSESSAARYVRTKLLSDVVHIAKDVKIQVEFNPLHVLAYRQVGYENRQLADQDFRNDVVDAGEIGSGHQMTALYEVVLVDGAMPDFAGAPPMATGAPVEGERQVGQQELFMVKLRYKTPGARETDPATELRASQPATPSPSALSSETAFAWAAASVAGHLAVNPFVTRDQYLAAKLQLSTESSGDRGDFASLVARLNP